MRPVVIDNPVACVSCQSVSLSVTGQRCAKTAERTKVLFGWKLLEAQGPRRTALDGCPDPLQRRAEVRREPLSNYYGLLL